MHADKATLFQSKQGAAGQSILILIRFSSKSKVKGIYLLHPRRLNHLRKGVFKDRMMAMFRRLEGRPVSLAHSCMGNLNVDEIQFGFHVASILTKTITAAVRQTGGDMRKSRQETAETRQRIVEAASAEFRRDGLDGTGLADLMAAAGLTHGGFYKHFESKEQVIEESLALAIESMVELMQHTVSASPAPRGLQTMIADYLSIKFRDDVAGGCPFVALGSDMARSGDGVREAATSGFVKMVDIIASQLGGSSPATAKKEALVMLSTMIGAVTMARIVTDPKLSASILQQARKHLTRAS
jgi:TetR/AcrR family transcriptional regulator, transcriptional repressor for nem operon